MTHQTRLFTPLQIKTIKFKNRIWVSPMCQYSSIDGHPTEWHFVHLGSRAVGGAGLVMIEATAVSPEGRISPDDSGIWKDQHIPDFQKLTDFITAHGAVPGIQLAHAGRKGSTAAPWFGQKVLTEAERGWQTLAPSAIPFYAHDVAPKEMNHDDMQKVIDDFIHATQRCIKAGFQVLELHMAHGYLMHQFLSPLSNHRSDEYGGSLENRVRFPLEIAAAVRNEWPQNLPLFARISTTDWADGSMELISQDHSSYDNPTAWTVDQSIIFAQKLKDLGIDLIDCSSGGTLAKASIPVGPGYQVPFAERIRREAEIMTAAVGLITDPIQAEGILVQQQADAVFLARELLRNPYWPSQAAQTMGVIIKKPLQYERA